MNTPPVAEGFLWPEAPAQPALALATEGVLRYAWQGRFGPMLVEVRGGKATVNGRVVETAEPALPPEPLTRPFAG